MIRDVEIDRSPIAPGERRRLRARGNAAMTVGIACFTNDPPPPGYKPCDACGSFYILDGDQIEVVADRKFFSQHRGYLDIVVKDATGDEKRIRIVVGTAEPEDGQFLAEM